MRTLSCLIVSLLGACGSEPSQPPFENPSNGGQIDGTAAGAMSASGSAAPSGGASTPSSGASGLATAGALAGAGANGSGFSGSTSSAGGISGSGPAAGNSGGGRAGSVGSSGESMGGAAGGSAAGSLGSAGQPPAPPVGGAACGTALPGTAVGSPIENFELSDQAGNKVSLSSYCDKVVYIVAGAMWCPGCRTDAEELEAIYQQYKDQGLVTLSLMAENARSRTPTAAELATWATTYGITTPVLADPEWKVWLRYWPARATPKELLVGRNGIIADLTYPGTRDIERALGAR